MPFTMADAGSSSPPGTVLPLRCDGGVLLVSCYELGHQPVALATAAAFLERAGYEPRAVDLALQQLDSGQVARAALVAISVPMHTALRIGVHAAEQVRRWNPAATICFFGLYAFLNREYLLDHGADAVLGGECEEALVALAGRLERGERPEPGPAPVLARLDFPVPSRHGLPPLGGYAAFERAGERRVAGVVEASRGCLHECLHCPIPPLYRGRFFVVPPETENEYAVCTWPFAVHTALSRNGGVRPVVVIVKVPSVVSTYRSVPIASFR